MRIVERHILWINLKYCSTTMLRHPRSPKITSSKAVDSQVVLCPHFSSFHRTRHVTPHQMSLHHYKTQKYLITIYIPTQLPRASQPSRTDDTKSLSLLTRYTYTSSTDHTFDIKKRVLTMPHAAKTWFIIPGFAIYCSRTHLASVSGRGEKGMQMRMHVREASKALLVSCLVAFSCSREVLWHLVTDAG
jgi:hypothetical protein